jgi:hypothetical protein
VVVRAPVRTDVDPPAGRRHRRGPLVFDDRADSTVGPVLIFDFGIGRDVSPKRLWAFRATQTVRVDMEIDTGIR